MKSKIYFKHTRIITTDRPTAWITPGAEAILVKISYETGGGHFELQNAPDGIGGNANPEVKCYHGWRGTSYGRSVHAYGLREILAVEEVKRDDDYGFGGYITLRVTLSKDLTAGEE